MKPDAIEKAIHASVCSLKMEGLEVDPSCIDLCRKMLSGEISMEEYLLRVTLNSSFMSTQNLKNSVFYKLWKTQITY